MSDHGDLTPLPGGHSGQTFVSEAGGAPVVVRIYPPGQRPDDAPLIDAALLRLVRGLVPVPDVLEVRAATGENPGLLVTELAAGERGDVVLPGCDADQQHRLGCQMGALAARLASMPMLRAGRYVDPELRIEPWPDVGLPEWVQAHAETLTERQVDVPGLSEVAVTAQGALDASARPCLVHSDLNPKNVLVDPDSLRVAALVDWEYAHSGHPYTDLGNLVRFDREPAYVAGVLEAWCTHLDADPDTALELAHCADLYALVDLAVRPRRDAVVDRALTLLRRVASARDAGAPPDVLH